jgi:hypothetical protein
MAAGVPGELAWPASDSSCSANCRAVPLPLGRPLVDEVAGEVEVDVEGDGVGEVAREVAGDLAGDLAGAGAGSDHGHARPPAGRARRPRVLTEVAACARAMRARSAPSSVSR